MSLFFVMVKFIYSEKATKFCEISTLDLLCLFSVSQIYGGDFAKFCGLLRIYELYRSSRRSMSIVTMKSKLNLLKFDSDVSQLGRACSWISIFLFPILRPPCDATLALCTANYFHIKIGIQINFKKELLAKLNKFTKWQLFSLKTTT